MEDVTRRFKNLLEQTLIPDFRSNKARDMNPLGFRPSPTHLSETDMADFLRGWDAQLFRHIGKGLYRAPRSNASEQFFWSGRKANTPRTFTIWIEPIITLAVLARMHLDFKWPKTLLGTQSKPAWAFDVLAYRSEFESDRGLFIACEVKKCREDVDDLIRYMQLFGRQPALSSEHLKRAQKNAFMKVKGLRDDNPYIFWAVGPSRHEKVFLVQYSESGVVEFEPTSFQALIRKGDF